MILIAITILIIIYTIYSLYLHIKEKRRQVYAIKHKKNVPESWSPPKRSEIINKLKTEIFDIIVIGGGSTGAGCVLDGATRNLNIALVEAGDFSSQTSSKSTKLVHGGIRYLAKAFEGFKYSQLKLVRSALWERTIMFNISPYLTKKIPIFVPIYNTMLLPYYWIGLKIYDWLSGSHSLGHSYFINKDKVIDSFPGISKKDLKGGVVYYDGQQDDAKNNIMLIITAVFYGATAANYVKVVGLIEDDEKITGIVCKDMISGEKFEAKAKCVINTTGAFSDNIRNMQKSENKKLMVCSSGTHIVIPKDLMPKSMGFVDPLTRDGRIAFFLPYKGKTVVGSTDKKSDLKCNPAPTEEDLDFLLHEVKIYTCDKYKIKRKDILAAWTGMRPLIKEKNNNDNTENIVRKFFVEVGNKGLITVTGGKWTTYRIMAEKAIDKAISIYKFKAGPCITEYVSIIGSNGYSDLFYKEVEKKLRVSEEVAKHLCDFYGTRALKLEKYIKGNPEKLIEEYNYLVAEIEYCIDNEMAESPTDVICNRMMLSQIDVRAARKCLKLCLDIFKQKFNWNIERYEKEEVKGIEMLNTFGLALLNKASEY